MNSIFKHSHLLAPLKTVTCVLLFASLMGSNLATAQEHITPPQALPETSLPIQLPPDVTEDNADEMAPMFIPEAEPVALTEMENTEAASQDFTIASEIFETPSLPPVDTKLPNPEYELESIRISGNYQISKARILNIIGLAEGSHLTLEQLEDARIKLMISGLFKDASFHIYPGSGQQKLELELHVQERSPFQINEYFVGTSQKSPFWLGLDVSWLAPFASHHRLRMGFVATNVSDYSLQLNYFVPSVAQTPISLTFGIQSQNGHEGIFGLARIISPLKTNKFAYLDDMEYAKHGAHLGIGYTPTPKFRLVLVLEYLNLTRYNDVDTLSNALEPYLKSGISHMTSASISASYDTREGRVLPNSGHFIMVGAKGTAKTAASQYAFFKMHLAHQSNWSVAPSHILRMNTFGGFVLGDAPFFEKFFYNDFYALGTNRALQLNPSHKGAYDLFKTGTSSLGYEDFLAHLSFSYAWQPHESTFELFATVGATWANSKPRSDVNLGIQPESSRSDFPIDLSANAGARFKTDYGLFSVTIGHVLDLAAR